MSVVVLNLNASHQRQRNVPKMFYDFGSEKYNGQQKTLISRTFHRKIIVYFTIIIFTTKEQHIYDCVIIEFI